MRQMTGMHVVAASVMGLLLTGTMPLMAQAQTPAPGAPTSLQETYEDWSVACGQQQDGKRVCTMLQQQMDPNSGQRVVAMEMTSVSPAEGALLMPFGLAVSQPLTLEVDGSALGAPIPFRTCLSAGCLVPLKVDAASLSRLKSGTTLMLKATVDGGQPISFTLSLKGFGVSLDRLAVLLK